ncbi:MAG: ATP-binding cassette domain-containing protein [Dysosmobacter sp.]|nr:ATP-binding cassette domain-containing protein [Dysosmobacter sp.]
MSEPIIEIRGLRKTFGQGEAAVTALDGIDLSIEKGEIFGIIGLSGAGKSTLVRCMNLLETPTEGTVRVDGQDITTLSPKELRKARQSITMIFQGFNLLMQRSALDNICFPLELSGTPRKEAVARARELLKVVGLEGREGAYPAQLSGGQKQRVAIARALATNPKVLLCDEATSALDPTTTQSILALLQELNRTLGVTVVIITHEMKVVEQICGRVAILAESHVVEEGKVSEVFRHPKTAAARQLLMPGSETARETLAHGRAYRITFDGSTAEQPVVSGMVLSCGEPVNILFADMKNIEGKTYGQMLLQLPENEGAAARMLAYLESQRITYTEEEVK